MEKGNRKGGVEIGKDVRKVEGVMRENMKKRERTKYRFERVIGVSGGLKEVIEDGKGGRGRCCWIVMVGERGRGKEVLGESIDKGREG